MKVSEKKFKIQFNGQDFENITGQDFSEWETAYPLINIRGEILKSIQWLKSNPQRANKKHWRRFLTGWFCREQNRREARSGKGTKFSGIEKEI